MANEEPTIALQFDHAWCLNCRQRVSNVYARRHALVDEYTEGCGIEFRYVTTPASVNKLAVCRFRDDLKWKDIAWA